MEQTTKPQSKHGQPEASQPGVPAAVFEDIVCAVDGSRGSQAAARQTVALSGANGSLGFVAVHHTVGVGSNEQSTLSEHRARKALEEAEELAGQHGLQASRGRLRAQRRGARGTARGPRPAPGDRGADRSAAGDPDQAGRGAGAHLPSRPGEPGFADRDRQARPRRRPGARQRQRARRPPRLLLGPVGPLTT